MLDELGFKVSKLFLPIRKMLDPADPYLQDAGVKSGSCVLDINCGNGKFTEKASILVGKKGRVYALDKRYRAVMYVEDLIDKQELENIEVLHASAKKSNLPTKTIDVALLLGDRPNNLFPVLREVRRVLKSSGYMVAKLDGTVIKQVEDSGLFSLSKKSDKVALFKSKA